MADLRKLTTDAKRLYEALDYLLEKQDRANADDIDFKEIWFGAKSRPFEHHCIEQLELEEARSYLLILAGLIALADNADKKKAQIRFLARIIAGYKKEEIQLEDLVNDGLLIQEKNIDELLAIKEESIRTCLLVDLLLMIYLDEIMIDKQTDYVVGTIAFVGINKEKTCAIGNIVKGILEQRDEIVLSQARYIDITGVYCYMQNLPDGILVSDLCKAKDVDTDKIIFFGLTWEALPTININDYKAKIIEFSNCEFKSLQGFVCKTKKVILKNCVVSGCETGENLFVLKNAEIIGCKINEISSYDTKKKHLIYLLDSNIVDTVFSNIVIKHNSSSPFGGVLKAKNTVMKDVIFEGITTKSSSKNSYRRVFDFEGGRLVNCSFKNCSLAKDSYLLTIASDTSKSQLVVERLNSNYGQENNYYYYSNNEDLSIAQVFGGK